LAKKKKAAKKKAAKKKAAKKKSARKKNVVELEGPKSKILNLFSVLGIKGKELDSNMSSKALLTEGFVLEVENDIASFYSGNTVKGMNVLLYKMVELDGITVKSEGLCYCAANDELLSRIYKCESGKMRISIGDKKIEMVDSANHKSGFTQTSKDEGEDRVKGWKDIIEDNIGQHTRGYKWSDADVIASMVVDAEELAKIVKSAEIMRVVSYPIKIRDGKVIFSVENEFAWESREIEPDDIEMEEEEYEANYHTGVDAALSNLEEEIVINMCRHPEGVADVMAISKVEDKSVTVFYLIAISEDDLDEPEEDLGEEEFEEDLGEEELEEAEEENDG